jgi:hypothetical protein
VTAAANGLVARKLSGLGEAAWDWSRIQAFALEQIHEVIAARGVAPGDLTAPRPDIAIPAIEAMRYCELRAEMAALIASTMDAGRTEDAHPAFIEILKQLTRDEVRILALLPPAGRVLPMVNIAYIDRSDRILSSVRHILPLRIAGSCASPAAIAGSVDNLLRLNLVSSPPDLTINEERHYRDLLAQPFLEDMEARRPAHLKAEIERRVITLTDFGDRFRRCCLSKPDQPS